MFCCALSTDQLMAEVDAEPERERERQRIVRFSMDKEVILRALN